MVLVVSANRHIQRGHESLEDRKKRPPGILLASMQTVDDRDDEGDG